MTRESSVSVSPDAGVFIVYSLHRRDKAQKRQPLQIKVKRSLCPVASIPVAVNDKELKGNEHPPQKNIHIPRLVTFGGTEAVDDRTIPSTKLEHHKQSGNHESHWTSHRLPASQDDAGLLAGSQRSQCIQTETRPKHPFGDYAFDEPKVKNLR